jgi:membrane protein CcdC involved in cytochrome C biogenesis
MSTAPPGLLKQGSSGMPIDPFDLPPALYLVTTVLGAALVMTWRVREAKSPVTLRKIIIPPLGMSTGLFMFLVPETRVPLLWAGVAVGAGATLFAWPLMHSSRLTRSGDQVLMERSRIFILILLGLVAVRFGLRAYVEQFVSTPQTGALFFLLALAAVVRWRVQMLRQFLVLRAEVTASGEPGTPAS